jgi:hypothetical protein
MKNLILATGLALSLLPLTVTAAPAHHVMKSPKMAATTYQCQKCHMKVSAAVAKKDGYKDPMDGGKLVPTAAAPAKAAPAGKPMGGMKM